MCTAPEFGEATSNYGATAASLSSADVTSAVSCIVSIWVCMNYSYKHMQFQKWSEFHGGGLTQETSFHGVLTLKCGRESRPVGGLQRPCQIMALMEQQDLSQQSQSTRVLQGRISDTGSNGEIILGSNRNCNYVAWPLTEKLLQQAESCCFLYVGANQLFIYFMLF